MRSDLILLCPASTSPLPDVYDGGWEHFVGGGVAAFDCDGDDLPELYAAGGSKPAQLRRNGGPVYRNARFERGTTAHLPHVGADGRPLTAGTRLSAT